MVTVIYQLFNKVINTIGNKSKAPETIHHGPRKSVKANELPR